MCARIAARDLKPRQLVSHGAEVNITNSELVTSNDSVDDQCAISLLALTSSHHDLRKRSS